MTTLAHGIGTRTDLPIPLSLALFGAGAAVLVSFAALLAFWRRPALGGQGSGRPVPAAVQRLLDAGRFRTAAQAVALTASAFVVVVAFAGPPGGNNLAPWVLYVTFWVGLVPASLLFGPVWRVVNPLRLLYRLLSRVTGPAPGAGHVQALGMWPAAVSLLAFVWLELVFPERTEPPVVGAFLVLYAAVQLLAALWFGEGWFSRGDGFEVYSTLIAKLSPWGRRDDGRLVARNPLTNAMTVRPVAGLAAVVVVLLGSTAFDGLTRTEFWATGPGAENGTLSGTLGLLVMIGLVAAFYVAATAATGVLGGLPPGQEPRRYAHSVIPIVIGYTVAHYFSLWVFDGQKAWILASNPLGTPGVDLFGASGDTINYQLVGPDTISYVQVAAVVLGHVLGVVLAHEQALREQVLRATARTRAVEQLPLVVVMVGLTVTGLGLLFGF
ncbi:hypothetical protein [Blastococcus saxobsidens]|uniref:Fenitrothion hydrolase n=1 Tax=Blastococcus saxobsidens (strain DD2) TaxID=1146883 RepID=H6RRL2_BLASD|nr:hypothetical protein [Blastococcus saxobsidens]CCG01655.1 conserved membrane protein of unknown function [Blastococcus saxobsidens DD2]